MFKNVSGQKFRVFAFDATTNLPKSGDAGNITAYTSKDFGAVTVLADTSATEEDATNAKGYYLFDAAQAETNADDISVTGKSSTSNIVVVGAPARLFPFPPNFTTLSIDTNGNVKVQTGVKKNTALTNFSFLMVSSTDNATPLAGLTVTATRRIDNGSFAACANAATEVANGIYTIDLAAADLNGDRVLLKFAATGAAAKYFEIITTP